jgi:hypothetical protein
MADKPFEPSEKEKNKFWSRGKIKELGGSMPNRF